MTGRGLAFNTNRNRGPEGKPEAVIPAEAGIWGRPSGWKPADLRPVASSWIPNQVWNDRGGWPSEIPDQVRNEIGACASGLALTAKKGGVAVTPRRDSQ